MKPGTDRHSIVLSDGAWELVNLHALRMRDGDGNRHNASTLIEHLIRTHLPAASVGEGPAASGGPAGGRKRPKRSA